MISVRKSVATQLTLGYAALVLFAVVVTAIVFYFGTVGTFSRAADQKIITTAARLTSLYNDRPTSELADEIRRELDDGIDSDIEIFLLLSQTGQIVAGNLSTPPSAGIAPDVVVTEAVARDGRKVQARLLLRQRKDGSRLYVGRDLLEQRVLQELVGRALVVGFGAALLAGLAGSILFRRQIEANIASIRRAATGIAAGDLKQRIPVLSDDEFGRLGGDINRMLDRIEHLMDGVRNVSNVLAHELRTPLARMRNRLEIALAATSTDPTLRTAAQEVMLEIDHLTTMFDQLLRIAEAEAGMRMQFTVTFDLVQLLVDLVELYDAAADDEGIVLSSSLSGTVLVTGQRTLLANAVSNVLDNALKYAGRGSRIQLSASSNAKQAEIVIEDNGPGIGAADREHAIERFYRGQGTAHQTGNGLGLSIVAAIVKLHGGALLLEDAQPGLRVRIVLPTLHETSAHDRPDLSNS